MLQIASAPFLTDLGALHDLGATIASLVVIFICLATFSKLQFFEFLTSPIGRVSFDSSSPRDPDYQQLPSLIILFGLYSIVGYIISLTSGTIGVNFFSYKQEESIQATFKLGYSLGLIMVAIARFSCVYVTTSLATYLKLLTAFFVGAIVFSLIRYYDQSIEFISNRGLPEGAAGSDGSFGLWAAINAFFVCAVAEVLITGIPKLNVRAFPRQAKIDIPYFLLEERIQQPSNIQQIFHHRNVTNASDELIKYVAENEGIFDFKWVTNEPPDHLSVVFDSMFESWGIPKEHLESICDLKIIIGDRRISSLVDFEDQKVSCRSAIGTYRVRYMILNQRWVLVHLPCPFNEADGHRANTVHLLTKPGQVSLWLEKFESQWRAAENNESLVHATEKYLNKLKVADLQSMALSLNCKLSSRSRKGEIVAVLLSHFKDKNSEIERTTPKFWTLPT